MKTLNQYRKSTLLAGLFGLAAAAALPAHAQYQVSQPGDPGPNAQTTGNTATPPAAAPGRELYGNNTAEKTPRYGPQKEYLPSEILIARQRSGALPSEIRAQSDAVGPLSPNGAADYIPVLSPLQRALNVPAPVLFGPAWQIPYNDRRVEPWAAMPRPAAPAARPRAADGTAEQRSPLEVTPQPVNRQDPYDARVSWDHRLGPPTPVNTTINRPVLRYRPATQPATQPAPSQAERLAPTLPTPPER